MLKKGFLFLFTFIISLIISIVSNAYTFTDDFDYGIYWASYPINFKIYADTNSDWSELYTHSNSSMNDWETEIGVNVWHLDGNFYSGGPVGNYIKWSNNFSQDTGYDSSGTLAVTIRYNNGTFFDKVAIILNAENAALKQNFAGLLSKTILHELGHTIGLGHTEEYAIMYAYTTNLSTLQSDDIEGARDAVSINDYRSSIGYSANKESSDGLLPSCGGMAFASDGSPVSMSGYGNIITILFGLVFVWGFKFALKSLMKLEAKNSSRLQKKLG